jgi:hypothetical protein
MLLIRSAPLVFALIGLTAVGLADAAPAIADDTPASSTRIDQPAPSKPKPHKPPVKLQKETSGPTAQYEAPLQLDFDPMKRVILKAEPALPYQPQVASRLPQAKTDDDTGQAHLAPLLRESYMPDSLGDKGSFLDRHEFGIQLKDHF